MSKSEMTGSQDLVADVIDNGQVSKQQVLVIILCMFFNTLDGFDITAMAVVASSVSQDLSLSPDRLGWIFSFALAGMMTGAMLLASVSDQIGRRKLIVLSLFLVGVSILLTARATTLAEFIILRFISGLGAGAMLACAAALASEYSPEKYKVLSVVAVTSGYPLGAMFTAVFAGLIMPEYGWRGMFWFGGAITLSMGLVAWMLIPESLKFLFEKRPANVLQRVNRILRKLKKNELSAMPTVSGEQERNSRGLLETMKGLLASEHIAVTMKLWITFFMSFLTLYFLLSWIPKLMDDAGFAKEVGRQAFFLFNFGGFVGVYIVGLFSIRYKLTNVVSVMLLSSAVGMIIFASLPGDLAVLMPTIFLIGTLQQGGFGGLYGAAAKAYPTEMRSTGIGWAIGLGRSGAVAGPAIAGYLIASGLDMSGNFYVFSIPMMISALICYRLHIR